MARIRQKSAIGTGPAARDRSIDPPVLTGRANASLESGSRTRRRRNIAVRMFDWWISLSFVRFLFLLGAVVLLLAAGWTALRIYLSGSMRADQIGLLLMCALGIAVCVYPLIRFRARQRMRLKSLGELMTLTPRAFEAAVADLLHDLKYRDIRHVGQSGDLAADLTCKDRKGKSVVVQCKRYAPGARIGSPDIQTFIGMITVHHGADRGIFVTTSQFSKPAIDLAEKHGIQLVDGTAITNLLAAVN